MVECDLAKVEVAGSNPVSRSKITSKAPAAKSYRGFFHATNLHRCIAELTAYKQPNLIVMDAIRGITANGPMGPGPIREYNQVIFGTDPVAVDAYGATLFGMKPGEIDYLRLAAEMGVGQINWEGLNVKKI